MKKLLLSASMLTLALTSNAQLNGTDGFLINNLDAASNCIINAGLPNHGGLMNGDGASFTASTSTDNLTAAGMVLTGAAAPITVGSQPTWFPLHIISGSGETASCSTAFVEDTGVDMTSTSKVKVVASGTAGDTLELFLGGLGQYSPSTSTYNTTMPAGTGFDAFCVFESTGVMESFTLDFNKIDATAWAAWTAKDKIQSVGFRTKTPDATFVIERVEIGSAVTSVSKVSGDLNVSVYPNPATDVVNVTVGSNNANVTLSDITGSVVASATGSGTVSLSTANVPAGLYVVSVSSATGVTTAKVVVK